MNYLKKSLQLPIDEIIFALENGVQVTEHNIKKYDDHAYEIGDFISGHSYLSHSKYIAYTVNEKKEFLGASIVIERDGSWFVINTYIKRVYGERCGVTYDKPYQFDALHIEEACKEKYNSI